MLKSRAAVALLHQQCCLHAPQDEREVKRQRRKQSNRESARRSRLRKQAECEALAVRVNELMNENIKLRAANEQLLKLQHLTSNQVSGVIAPDCSFVTELALWHLHACWSVWMCEHSVSYVSRQVRWASREVNF